MNLSQSVTEYGITRAQFTLLSDITIEQKSPYCPGPWGALIKKGLVKAVPSKNRGRVHLVKTALGDKAYKAAFQELHDTLSIVPDHIEVVGGKSMALLPGGYHSAARVLQGLGFFEPRKLFLIPTDKLWAMVESTGFNKRKHLLT